MPNKPPSLNTANSDVVDLNCKALGPQITQKTLASYVNAQSEGCLDIPTYIYDVDAIRSRFAMLRSLFGSTFKLSYAIKANPNQALLGVIAEETDYFDASSFAETIRAKEAGLEPHLTSYSGPGKRQRELDAFIGTDAELVIESSEEIVDAAAIASRKQVIQKVLVRINPDHVPRGFGASMSGKPSQFGFDESVVQQAIDEIDAHASLSLVGLHIYTGSNSLSSETLIENFQNMSRLFIQLSQNGTRPLEKLIFGAGFGLPYHIGQDPLDLKAVSEPLLKIATTLHAHSGLKDTALVLELGRWIVGPAGALLASILTVKESRGQQIAVCDAGFNNHLAACGMMGSVFRKDWPIQSVTDTKNRPIVKIKVTGPLCTSIDSLAGPMDMPQPQRGDVLAVRLSGAYGLTASPTRFISHPDPAEVLYQNGTFEDVSESHHNHVLR